MACALCGLHASSYGDRVGFGMAQWGRRGLLSLLPHPLPPRRGGEPQRVACGVGREGVGTGAPLRKGLRRLRAAAAAAASGGSLCHPVQKPRRPSKSSLVYSSREEHLGPRRPGLASVGVWLSRRHSSLGPRCAKCLGHFAPLAEPLSYCLLWPSLGVCHTGRRLRPAPRKTEGRVGPAGRRHRQPGEMLGAGSVGQGRLEGETPRVHGRAGALPQAPGEALIWKGRLPQAAVSRVWRQACRVQGPLEYTDVCSLPSKLFLAFMESPLKHKCQVCAVTEGPVL